MRSLACSFPLKEEFSHASQVMEAEVGGEKITPVLPLSPHQAKRQVMRDWEALTGNSRPKSV